MWEKYRKFVDICTRAGYFPRDFSKKKFSKYYNRVQLDKRKDQREQLMKLILAMIIIKKAEFFIGDIDNKPFHIINKNEMVIIDSKTLKKLTQEFKPILNEMLILISKIEQQIKW